jgi:hypothetical protein
MSGLAWLNDLMVWIGRLFPRLLLVKAGYLGVKFMYAARTKLLPAGLYCYWPIIEEITVVSTRARTTEVASQLHGTEVISIVVAFLIRDPQAMLLAMDDVFSQIDDRAQVALRNAYGGTDTPDEDMTKKIVLALRREFDPGGVNVLDVSVIQRGPVVSLKHMKDWAQHSKAEL